jgi:hypothetical protein
MSAHARPHVVGALGLLLVVAGPARPALAADAAPADSRAAAMQDGWWNRLQGPVDGEPEGNPVRPYVPAVPKPPNVPADAIATSGAGGQVDKVAAVGIDVALADGAVLDGLTLRLQEAPGSGANVGADRAKVTACPATVPWGPGQNAAWRERPTADCSLASADGVRAADGTWLFDLSAMGRLWAGPARTLAPNGVVLSVDAAGSPSPVQVSWLDVESGHVAVDLAVRPAAPVPASSSVPAADGGAGVPRAVNASSPAAAAVPSPFHSTASPPVPAAPGGAVPDLSAASGQLSSVAAPADASDHDSPSRSSDQSTPAVPPGRPAPVLRAPAAVGFWEDVPAATALLVPVALGLAGLIGVVLGPLGRPSPVFRREGGLSRALSRRSPGGPAAA